MDERRQDDLEIELMLRVRAGDSDAFRELSDRYRGPVGSFFYSLCWNYDAAQDYAQEVLIRIWLARERYEPTAKPATYLFRIARNYWSNVLRYRRCHPEAMGLEQIWEPFIDESDVERVMMRRYESARIRRAIAGLPEHYRVVFILSHFESLKYQEIAEVLEIPVGTVKSRMSAAIRLLRDVISKEE